MENNILREKKRIAELYLIVFAIFAVIYGTLYFRETHFLYGTEIEGVSCSFLSIEDAIEKIKEEKGEETRTFCFSSGRAYDVSLTQLGIDVDKNKMTQIFEYQHSNPKEPREYQLDGFISIDAKLLKAFLEEIPEMKEENMVEPQNALIAWAGTEFLIQKETYGSVINLEEAITYASEKIKNDEEVVNFTLITDIYPEIFAEDLESEKNELNTFLNSSINFELTNGEIVTLDSNTIKYWVYLDENGKFAFDTEYGVSQFVDYLASKVDETNSSIQFTPTDFEGTVTLDISSEARPRLDKEKEITEIMGMLGNPDPIYTKPIYDKALITDNLVSYVELDISRQHLWFYVDGELYVETDCVTGTVSQGYDTPIGVFYLLNKNRGVMLEGYNNDGSKYSSYVEYWMRFYQGVGMHDAQWRSQFGGNIYKTSGSHGCVNLPFEKAEQIYEVIDETMPIIVYQSEASSN